MIKHSILMVFALPLLMMAGCSEAQNTVAEVENPAQQAFYELYKSPTCGCCEGWMNQMSEQGYSAAVHHPENLDVVKAELGVRPQYQSCHTAVWQSGHVFEGHIPARYIEEFLRNPPPDAIGLAVPGMPMGSPGMEMGDRFDPYDILLLKVDGNSEVFARVENAGQQ